MKTLGRSAQVQRDPVSDLGIVSDKADGAVAEITEQAADTAGVVAVVDGEAPAVLIETATRRADSLLRQQHRVVLSDRDPVPAPEPSSASPRLPLLRVRRKPPFVNLEAPPLRRRITRVLLPLRITIAVLAPARDAASTRAALQYVEAVEREFLLATRTSLHTNNHIRTSGRSQEV